MAKRPRQGRNEAEREEIGRAGRNSEELQPRRGRGRHQGADAVRPASEEEEFQRWQEDQDLEEDSEVE